MLDPKTLNFTNPRRWLSAKARRSERKRKRELELRQAGMSRMRAKEQVRLEFEK